MPSAMSLDQESLDQESLDQESSDRQTDRDLSNEKTVPWGPAVFAMTFVVWLGVFLWLL